MTTEERFERIESIIGRLAENHLELEAAQLNQQRSHSKLEEAMTRFSDETRERLTRFTHETREWMTQFLSARRSCARKAKPASANQPPPAQLRATNCEGLLLTSQRRSQ